MKWATRAGCHIDRAACAWLIRRFLDPEAEFTFVDDPRQVPNDATPFDMRGVTCLTTMVTVRSRRSSVDTNLTIRSCGKSPRSFTKPTSPTTASTLPRRWGWRC